MPTCGGDFQGAFGLRLSLYFAHIRVVRTDGLRLADVGRDAFPASKMRRHWQQCFRRIYDRIFHQRSFCGICLRKNESASTVYSAIGHCQSAAYRTQFAGQRELSGVFIFSEFVGGDLSGGGEYAECDG